MAIFPKGVIVLLIQILSSIFVSENLLLLMNYHCLRVFRSGVRTIGKQLPGFSVFRTRVHGCSDAELCRVPIQSTVGAIFLLGS